MENEVRTTYYNWYFSKEPTEGRQHPIFQQEYLNEGNIADGIRHSMEKDVFCFEIGHQNIMSKLSFPKKDGQYIPTGFYQIFLGNKKCFEINVEYQAFSFDKDILTHTFIQLFDFIYFINNYGDFSQVNELFLKEIFERVPYSTLSIETVEEEQPTYRIMRDYI